MRISKAVLTAVALTVVPGIATIAAAQVQIPPASDPAPTPVPIEEWPLAKVVALGEEIYRQDTAAWVATDALVAAVGRDGLTDLKGWIVVPDGADQKVRFLKRTAAGMVLGWDVTVSGDKAGPVAVVTDGALTADETARFAARQTALANMGELRCSRSYNPVVLRDPDSDGWLVWLLAGTTDANIVPFGGHYRFRISPDGQTVLRRDQLSNGCLNMSKQQGPDGQPAGLVVTQIVSAGPVETHVFLSLQNRLPIYVSAGDKLFAVEGARIRDASAALRR